MRGTFALLITLLMSFSVRAQEDLCQTYKEVLTGCDQGACGGIEIVDEYITENASDSSFKSTVSISDQGNSSTTIVTSNYTPLETSPALTKKNRALNQEIKGEVALNIKAVSARENMGEKKVQNLISKGLAPIGCQKIRSPDSNQINRFININRKIRQCSLNTFLALNEVGNVNKFCSNIESVHVYKTLCSSDCPAEQIPQADQEKAKTELVKEAKSVILKMYRNRLFETLDQLSMIPHKGNFYESLPRECTSSLSFLEPKMKEQLQSDYEETLRKHQDLLAEDKEQNECFPNGIVKYYFQYSQGEFQYLDKNNSSPEVRSLDFANQAKVYQDFSKLFDDCVDGSCRESYVDRKSRKIDKTYQAIKDDAASACSMLQEKLAELSKPDNYHIALNPQVLNIRKNYNNISFSETKHPDSFITKCSQKFDINNYGNEKDLPSETQCMAVKQLICKGKEVDPKVVDETRGNNMREFEKFSNHTYGARRFRDAHTTLADRMCNFIKEEYDRSPDKGQKEIQYFAIDFFKNSDAVNALQDELYNNEETKGFFGGKESVGDFLNKFGGFNNVTKLAYLEKMYKHNKSKAVCAMARQTMNLTTGKSCSDSESDGVKDIIADVKTGTVKKLQTLASKGFTNYDTALGDKQNQSLKFEEERQSRSIASVPEKSNSSTSEVNSGASANNINSPVSIPLSQQIQKDINIAESKLSSLEQKKTEVDSKVMRTLTEFTPDTPEAKAVIQEQKETNEEIERLREDIGRFKREKQQALAEERDTKLNREYEQTKQKLQSQGLSIAEVQDIPLQRTQKIADKLGENNYYANSVKQGVSSSPEIEILYPISASEYQEITTNEKLKPISMSIDEFDPVLITNKYLTDVERELGGSGSIVIDDKGRHLIMVTDRQKQDKVYYQLRVLEQDDGRKLVKGVFLPVSKKPELLSAVKKVSKRVLDKVPNIPTAQKAIKRSFAATYAELLKVLEENK